MGPCKLLATVLPTVLTLSPTVPLRMVLPCPLTALALTALAFTGLVLRRTAQLLCLSGTVRAFPRPALPLVVPPRLAFILAFPLFTVASVLSAAAPATASRSFLAVIHRYLKADNN